MAYEEVGRKGIVRRTERRVIGLFIDGTGLDRATRRINRKVNISALIRGVTSGLSPVVARYYTLIPYEDDSRQRAFLDAMTRTGLQVIVKRLPPKGVTRQVSVDVEMASDIIAFAQGHTNFSSLGQYVGSESHQNGMFQGENNSEVQPGAEPSAAAENGSRGGNIARVVTVVCPSRDLSYPIALAKELKVDTVTADFGQFNTGDVLKSAAKWIDLSDSETIWRE